MKDRTRLNHPPRVEVPSDNPPLVAPIYQSVKFEYPTVAETLRGLRGERSGLSRQLLLVWCMTDRRSCRVPDRLALSIAVAPWKDKCLGFALWRKKWKHFVRQRLAG